MKRVIVFVAAVLFCVRLEAADLFGDRVVAKGKNLEVRASEIEETFITFKANKRAAGQRLSNDPADLERMEKEILDHLIATRLLLQRATDADKTNGAAFARKFLEEKRSKAASEASFNRQILALGTTRERFEQDLLDQAIVKNVIDRELRSQQTATDAQIEAYYKEHPEFFKEPEKWKVQHIHLGFRDRMTLQEWPRETLDAKKKKMDELLKRARGGEDFAKLAKENSEDLLTRDDGGFYTFAKGQMPGEFEATAISLKPGQISDVVTTRFGWHIIKLVEAIPAKTLALADAKEKIREAVLQEATQKALPEFLKKIREEAGVQIIAEK